jgi:hypothetical protein
VCCFLVSYITPFQLQQAILDLQQKRGVDLHLTREQQDAKGSGTSEGAESGANEAGRCSDSADVTPQPKTTAIVTTTARALSAAGGDIPVAGSAVATAMGVIQSTTEIGSVQEPSPGPSNMPDEPMSLVWKPTDLLKQGVWKPTCGWREDDCDSDEDEDTSSVAKVGSALCLDRVYIFHARIYV